MTTNASDWVSKNMLLVRNLLRDSYLFSSAPWFHPEGVKKIFLISLYLANGLISGGVPIDKVESPDWIGRIAIDQHLLRIHDNQVEPLEKARQEMTTLAYKLLNRAWNASSVPYRYIVDVSRYRKTSKILYGGRLAAFCV